MGKRYRINLLIPYLDGEYYGSVFATLQREASRRNSDLFTIQALASTENPAAFDDRIGIDIMDGWLLMTNPHSDLPASERFLKTIESSGKPIVTIGYRERSIQCHSVVIDNHQAIRESVLHLVRDHGHRRIAFVGGTDHVDLMERFEGYKQALQECGIEYEDDLYFQVGNTLRQGGTDAADEMLKRGVDFTAAVAASDLNAMGLMERLQAAGYRIPEDMAVIGFDDVPSAATFHPPLTTVNQPVSELGRSSIDLLYRQIKGETLQHAVTCIPTEFVPRSSCGCPFASGEAPIEVMGRKLEQAEQDVDLLIRSHNQLAANWASAAREEYFDLSRMFRGISHWGCLCLWETDKENRKHLIIKQAFSTKDEPVPPIGLKIPIEQFPPDDWLPDMEEDEFVRIQSIRSDRQDLGFIVLVGPVDRLVLISEVDVTRISCNISVTALERDQLFSQVRSIAEQLEIVSRTTNDGIWDWDLTENRMHWSTRTHEMIASIGESLTSDPDSFFRLIDSEDYPRVTAEFNKHMNDGSPFKIEFRIRGSEQEQQLWLYAAGDSIRDESGNKTKMIGSLTNITEKKLAEEQITYLAFHDVLTGLPNRKLFQERFERCKADVDQSGHKLGIMLVDLDRFKSINDTMGHQAGDQLLQKISRMLESVVGESGTVARHGGDEFIVLVSDIEDVSRLRGVARQMIQTFQIPFTIEDQEIYSTASIGISVYPDHGTDLDALTRSADAALYKAKEEGKNRNEMYSPPN